MPKDDAVYLGHMLNTARKAYAKVRAIKREQFDKDEDLRLALAYLVQILGEAALRIRDLCGGPLGASRNPLARNNGYAAQDCP